MLAACTQQVGPTLASCSVPSACLHGVRLSGMCKYVFPYSFVAHMRGNSSFFFFFFGACRTYRRVIVVGGAMFRDHVFVAAPDVPQDVRLLIAACGGRVVSSLEMSVTLGLVVGERRGKLDWVARLRGLRVPILRASWVRASVAAGRMLPMRHPHAEHDPELFAFLHFTTTMLPADVKARAVAAIQFFGGTYSPHLTTATSVLLYADGGVTRSEKWWHAQECAIPCVPVSWLQRCISTGRRCALPGATAAAAASCGKGAGDDDCGPPRGAALVGCGVSLTARRKRSRDDTDNVASMADF